MASSKNARSAGTVAGMPPSDHCSRYPAGSETLIYLAPDGKAQPYRMTMTMMQELEPRPTVATTPASH
jgi:hypothetical protein